MFISYYRGEGFGAMNGVTEYMVLSESRPDTSEDGWRCPGFGLHKVFNTEIDYCFDELPMETIIAPRGL